MKILFFSYDKRIISAYFICLLFIFNVFGKTELPYTTNRLAIISTWNIKCGIATYTKNIVNALHEKNIYPKVYSNTFVLRNLMKKIKKDKITILNIQFKEGLYQNFTDLLQLAGYAKKRGIKLILTLHGIGPNMYHLFKYADKVIIHKKIEDYSVKKIKKLKFIPMGTPVFHPSLCKSKTRLKYGFSDTDKIIVTTGFMFTAKQHANILKEMVAHIKQSPRNKVQLLTAFNDTALDECKNEFEKISNVIKDFSLEDQVTHITDFISQQELSERIWLSDLGYLWMEGQTNETSAATKEFIAGRTPLVVCDSNHFHDIEKGMVRLPLDKKNYAKSIFELLNSDKLVHLRTEMELLYQSTNYNNLIDHFIKIYFN